MITIPREVCRDLDQALAREWLVTNGRGSYASSTITGMNIRRYHGLLVAALEPPLGRTVLLAKLDEEVEAEGFVYRLGTSEFQNDVLNPDGYLFLEQVVLDGMIPTFHYAAAPFRLTKTIWMDYGRDTTYIRYELADNSSPLEMTLLPLCDYRDFHTLTQGKSDWRFKIEQVQRGFRALAYDGARPFRVLVMPEATFTPLDLWYWHYEFRAERHRGLDHQGDYYLPGLLRAHLEPTHALTVIITCEADAEIDFNAGHALQQARARQSKLTFAAPDEFSRQLFIAADQFIVERPNALSADAPTPNPQNPLTTLAGYHWFGDWGRDTMIALEGLTLTTKRFSVAREILLTFARFVSEGMLPNRFPDRGETPDYNTVDATLWYFHAIARYTQASGDQTLFRELFPILRDIIEWHHKGTRFNIHVDPQDGLLYAGQPGVQLTWMDAKVGDWVVTPRMGKPVEVNALWYNALCLMDNWAASLGEPSTTYRAAATRAAESFDRFWYADGGYLYDVLDGPSGNDTMLRPNQLFALSLDHSPITRERALEIIARVAASLLTPYGLRSLAPTDPNYHGEFKGDLRARDAAYHNGTVWTWLLGAYLDALRRFHPEGERPFAFDALAAHLADAGIGTLSECYDGNAPYRPGGCIAQAWSVAEVLRTYLASKN